MSWLALEGKTAVVTGGASGIGIAVKAVTGINISYTVYAINIIMFIIGYFMFYSCCVC